MALTGFEDLTLVGAMMKESRKVTQIRKNPDVALAIGSCKEFSDPCVVIQVKGTVHEDPATKQKYWNPMYEPYFQNPENPVFVLLKFVPQKIEYYHDNYMEIWTK
jgi:general stress protein 26